MKHKFFTSIIAIIISLTVLVPTISFADYGSTIPVNAKGTSNSIITIKRPESLTACTSDRTYTISATGAQGTKIKIYKLNPKDSVGKLVANERQIGASGLYSTVVELNNENNTFIVYAQNSSGTQVVKIEINKIKKSTLDRLRSVTVSIKNFLS